MLVDRSSDGILLAWWQLVQVVFGREWDGVVELAVRELGGYECGDWQVVGDLQE